MNKHIYGLNRIQWYYKVGTMDRPKREHVVSKEELVLPEIAWPTLIVAVNSILLYLYPYLVFWNNPTYTTIPLSALSVYLSFTPLHDAVHRSISTKYRWINEWVGHVCGVPLQAPFHAFRYCHLQHHKHTNDPENDPDVWSSSADQSSFWRQLLSWSTQSSIYVSYYIRQGIILKKLPLLEVCLNLFELLFFYFIMVVLICNGYWKQMLYFAILPRLIAETFLAYSFDYVPHRVNNTKRTENIYKCTNHISGLFSPDDNADLTIGLLYQNYHNIHHLYPTIPFYYYKTIWDNHKEVLTQLGTPFTSLFGPAKETHVKTH